MTVVAPTGSDLAQFLTILPSLVGQINADVVAVGSAAQAAPRLTAGTDLNDLDTPRTDWVTATIDSIGNVPPGEVAGFVRTFWQSTTNRVQVWYTSGLSTNVWIRFRGSSGWTAWKRMDAQYAIDTAAAYTDASVAGMGSASASGYKTVPVALTVGGSPATYGVTTAGIRMPMDFAPTITRWRVHVRNINPRFGLNNAGSIALTGLWFGAHNGSGNFTGTPTQIVGAVSTPSDGSEYVSPWVASPLTGGSSYLLAYGFTAGSATQTVVGGGWSVAAATDATNNAATKTAQVTMPLDVWLEVEVPSGVPVVAGVGDSLMSGVGSTQPVHDSTVSQYARANGALPMHYSASGDAASASTDSTAYKWSRWKALARPDAALVGMGSNDIFGGDSLGTVQTNYQALLGVVSASLTKNIYAATIMPRDAITGSMETTRRSFNTWLRGLNATGVRDVFDFVPGVSSDDETLTPALQADGIHLTTAGYAANSAAITRVIAPPQASGPQGPAGTVTDSSVAALVPGATSVGTALDIRGDARYQRGLRIITPEMYGAIGDGTANDTTALQNFFAALNTNGGYGSAVGKYYITGAITVNGLSGKPFTIEGAAQGSIIARFPSLSSVINLNNCTSVKLRNIALDCGRAETGFSNHGIAAANCTTCSLEGIGVTNWLNTGLMFYYSSGLTGSSFRNHIIDARLDGGAAANNGIMLETTTEGSIVNPRIHNLGRSGSPGYGIQFKNDTRRCRVVGGYVDNAVAGVAFGQTTGTGPSSNSIEGIFAYNCKAGFIGGYSNNNTIRMKIDMASASDMLQAIRFENGSIGNTVVADVDNVYTTAACVRIDGSDNRVHLQHINGKGARIYDIVGTGSTRNQVRVGSVVGATGTPFTGSTDAGTGNAAVYEGI